MNRFVISIIVSSIFVVSAFSVAQAAPDQKYVAQVKELLDVTKALELQEVMINQIADSLTKEAKNPAKAKAATAKFFRETIGGDILLKDYAEIYSRSFTLNELSELTSFYKSALGQKVTKEMPVIMQAAMKLGQAKVEERLKQFQDQKKSMEGFN